MKCIVLLGSPGSGRTTLGRILAKRYGLELVSTGNLLRVSADNLGSTARSIRQTMDSGNLVSDDVVDHLLAAQLASPECADGFVLDGYPRTLAQAKFLDDFLKSVGAPEPLVLQLSIEPAAAVERLKDRTQCVGCGRVYNGKLWPPGHPGYCDDDGLPLVTRIDDSESPVVTRMQRYAETVDAILNHYRNGHGHKLDAELSPGSLLEIVEGIVDSRAFSAAA